MCNNLVFVKIVSQGDSVTLELLTISPISITLKIDDLFFKFYVHTAQRKVRQSQSP